MTGSHWEIEVPRRLKPHFRKYYNAALKRCSTLLGSEVSAAQLGPEISRENGCCQSVKRTLEAVDELTAVGARQRPAHTPLREWHLRRDAAAYRQPARRAHGDRRHRGPRAAPAIRPDRRLLPAGTRVRPALRRTLRWEPGSLHRVYSAAPVPP